MLFQVPDLSVYWYCWAGLAFHTLTLLMYMVYGWGGGNGVYPPAQSTVAGSVPLSPASQRLKLTFIGVCGYWEPLPSASAALSVRITLPSIDQISASLDQSRA